MVFLIICFFLSGKNVTEREILNQIKDLSYSLFNARPAMLATLKVQDNDSCDELDKEAWVMDANFDVAVSLMKYEAKLDTRLAENVMETIYRVLKADERDVNAWMNKAMFETLKAPSDLFSAMEALTRAKGLLVEVNPSNEARVQYGFWLCTMMNDDLTQRQRGIQLLAESLEGEEAGERVRHHYLYLKCLALEFHKKSWKATETSCRPFIEQCIKIFKIKHAQYQLQMFLMLANVQRNDNVARQFKSATTLREEFGKTPDIKFCIGQVDELLSANSDIKLFVNTYVRIAQLVLHFAVSRSHPEDKVHQYLDKALYYAEQKGTPSRHLKGPLVCAKVFLYKWAIKYYAANKDAVDEAIKQSRGFEELKLSKCKC